MKRGHTKSIALSGILAAVAVVVMLLGGLIPLSTYVCPMICCLICFIVYAYCGRRMAWVWYFSVSLLSALLGPDPEAVAVLICLGFYPIIRTNVNKSRFRLLLKILIFNIAVCIIFLSLFFIMGVQISLAELRTASLFGSVLILLLGNITFLLLDKLLSRMEKKLFNGG